MRDLRAIRWMWALLWGAAVACAQGVSQGAGSVGASASANAGLALQISELLNVPSVARAHWGIDVTELDGTPIYALNEGQFFQPASNAKLFTTAAAMAVLGPTRTFETRVVAKGTIAQGVLKGDLELIGGGDANLSGRVFPYALVMPAPQKPRRAGTAATAQVPAVPVELKPLRYLEEMADRVAASGLKVVEGDVVGDDTYFAWEPYGTDWSVDDLVWGYGAPVSALSVNDNKIKVTVTGGAKRTDQPVVTMEPDVEYYAVNNRLTSGGDTKTVGMDRAPGSKVLNLFGGIGVNATDVEDVAILDPAEYSAMALKQMLEARGIVVKGKVRVRHWIPAEMNGAMISMGDAPRQLSGTEPGTAGRMRGCSMMMSGEPVEETLLATHTSPPLGQDVVWTNKVSQNLHAEIMLRNLGKGSGCMGSLRSGTTALRNFLVKAGVDKDDVVFFDGSGLSGHDLVTPRATVKLLEYATGQPWFAAWKRSLPVGGVDGSLENRFTKDLKGKVFAKTGTLGETRALSGYVECASGKTVVFAVFVGNHAPGSTADRDVMDRIVAAIAAAN